MSHYQQVQKVAQKKALSWYRSLPHTTKAHMKLPSNEHVKRYWLRNIATPSELAALTNTH